MKFENPIMNISMFEVENVVTGSGDPATTAETGTEKATAALQAAGVTNTVKVTF